MNENKLPSRFQIGDTVRFRGNEAKVMRVEFTEPKVHYTLLYTKVAGAAYCVDSCDVEPA